MQISSKNKLKANHNMKVYTLSGIGIDANIFKEQTESKSQHIPADYSTGKNWCKYLQRTNWKQITTVRSLPFNVMSLMQISSKNKLKANHNCYEISIPACVLMQISSKNKLKANHNMWGFAGRGSHIDANIFKEQTESKSQLGQVQGTVWEYWCKYLQRTNWKQITTRSKGLFTPSSLMQISSKNKLKANHNYWLEVLK